MIDVRSSNVSAVWWEPTESAESNPVGDLIVEFRNGSKYVYHGVTQDVALQMALSPSTGKFLNEQVKGRYEYQQLTEAR